MTETELAGRAPASTRFPRAEAHLLARDAYDRFATAVAALGPDDWRRDTDCTGWTVRDLVGHVVGAMRSAASTRELLSQQLEIARRVGRDGGNQVDVMTQLQIERTAGLDEGALVAECRRLVEPAARGRHRTPAALRRLVRFRVDTAGRTERWPLGYLVDVILTRDAWLHRVDLARATGAELALTPEHDGRVVADVVAEWASRHRRPYLLELTGPAGGHFAAGSSGEHHRLDAVEFCRVVSGRVPGDGLLAVQVPF